MEIVREVRQAVRRLRQRPGFTAVAAATLALGIGANTAIFSVVHPVLVRPLPYERPERLVWISEVAPSPGIELTSAADYLEWRDSARSLRAIAAFDHGGRQTLTGHGDPERLAVSRVSASFLPTLGVAPAQGRGFLAEEERPGGPRAALVSAALWSRLFGPRTALDGQTLVLDGQQHAIAGVLPASFRFPHNARVQALLPLPLDEASERGRARMSLVQVVGRLAPEATAAGARAELAQLKERAAAEAAAAPAPAGPQGLPPAVGGARMAIRIGGGPGGPGGGGRPGPFTLPGGELRVVPLAERLVGEVRTPLLLLFGAVALVLLAACANVANLLLAEATGRHRELVVRTALGASRRRLLGLLLVESLLLGLLGGALGVLLAFGGIQALRAALPGDLAGGLFRQVPIRLDGAVLLWSLLTALGTALLFGLAPAALATRLHPGEALKESGAGVSAGRRKRRLRALLASTEVALATVLVAGAGLLLRSFARVLQVDAGFATERVLTLAIDLDPARRASPAAQTAFFRDLLARVEALPGVEAAALADSVPLTPYRLITVGFRAAGGEPIPMEEAPQVALHVVTPDYLRVLGIRLLAGRAFKAADSEGAEPVAMVSQGFARRFFGEEDPVGRQLALGPGSGFRVVGLVADTRHEGLEKAPRLEVFRPFAQQPLPFAFLALRSRTADPASLVHSLRQAVSGLDPGISVYDTSTMEQRLRDTLAARRFQMRLVALFAALALVLAALGLYAVLSWSVAERRREIGIRMSLGAHRRQILRLVLRQGLALAGAGLVAGLAGALAAARLARGALFGVPATDAATFASIAILLLAVAALASYLPARRATAVDPLAALRDD